MFNGCNGANRTGAYAVATAEIEDGFELAPTRAVHAAPTLERYHTADTSRDGKIGLFELIWMIELYNYRNGSIRTGQYHVLAGTEDGFAPGS